jgi:hypothetical protein
VRFFCLTRAQCSFLFEFDGFRPTWFGLEDSGENSTITGLVKINSLQLDGARDGSAWQCLPCAPGTAASAGQVCFVLLFGHTRTHTSRTKDMCLPCAPGTFSAGNQSTCTPCVGQSFTSTEGETSCLQCGAGTQANPTHTDCTSACIFTAPGNVTYDLSSLKSPDMYGPIVDPNNHQYYISVCDKTDRNHACHDSEGRPITSYICQVK